MEQELVIQAFDEETRQENPFRLKPDSVTDIIDWPFEDQTYIAIGFEDDDGEMDTVLTHSSNRAVVQKILEARSATRPMIELEPKDPDQNNGFFDQKEGIFSAHQDHLGIVTVYCADGDGEFDTANSLEEIQDKLVAEEWVILSVDFEPSRETGPRYDRYLLYKDDIVNYSYDASSRTLKIEYTDAGAQASVDPAELRKLQSFARNKAAAGLNGGEGPAGADGP